MTARGRAAAFAGAALLLAGLAEARAGGGSNYTPGHGGDGDGGGGAIIGLFFRIIFWAFTVSPLFGLFVVALIITLAIVAARQTPTARTQRAVRTLDAGRFTTSPDAATLKAKDPGFTPEAFLARVGTAFLRVQEAWSRADLRPVRPFVSDAVWNRFRTLLELDRRHQRKNVMSETAVQQATIVAAVPGQDFDELHVRIQATARDCDVPAAATPDEIARVLARTRPEPFAEIWSFLRRAGAATLGRKGALEGSCPSCGAPLDIADVVACRHCGNLVNSGVHDWVLAEITQEVAWSGASDATVGGLAELKANDPAASRQAIEDRASLAFWRWLEAQITGSVEPLRRLATPDFLTSLGPHLAAPAPLDFPAVGSADLVRVDSGVEAQRAHVRINWSARSQGSPESYPRTSFLVLVRPPGTRTLRPGLAAASCPQCGGPLPATDTPQCDYCGADLEAIAGEFALAAVLTPVEWGQTYGRPAQADAMAAGASDDDARISEILLPDPSVPLEREHLVHALVVVAAADGSYARGEVRLLRAAARRFTVPRDKLDAWMKTALERPGDFADGGLRGPLLVRALSQAALVDGRVDARERALLRSIGVRSGLAPEAVDRLVAAESQRVSARRAAV